uniref:Uncharacterized protein n=1 Tax=Setaria viridis TaxID=4556 RepID=A0A4U6SX53_SETVI|nr:hypothetical protein SEVIR_9G133433v2 [Setaria viridis]
MDFPNVNDDTVLDSPLPSLGGCLRDLHRRRRSIQCSSSEDEPHNLGDPARVSRPGPKLNATSISWVEEISVNTLERAGAADDPLDELRLPSMPRNTVEDQSHSVEESRPESACETPPWSNADVRAAALELAFCVDLLAASPVLEADEERLRPVSGDVDIAWPQPEVRDEGLLQVPRRGVGGDAHGPGDQRASLPVPQLPLQFKGGGDMKLVFLWPESRVANREVLHPQGAAVARGRQWLLATRWGPAARIGEGRLLGQRGC